MFKGAKVVRGPDWEWKESDKGSEMEGEITEITGWSDDTLSDAVRVAWKNGPKGNIYRLGTNGKVRLLLSFFPFFVGMTRISLYYLLPVSRFNIIQ